MQLRLAAISFLCFLISFQMSDAAAQECSFGNQRGYAMQTSAIVDATNAGLLKVVAREGGLEVEGRSSLTEVRVNALACATNEELLQQIQLVADRRDNTVYIEAVLPGWLERAFNRGEFTRLDLFIETPADIAADIVDTSGPIDLRRLGALTLSDGTGPIRADSISGAVYVKDDAGEIRISNVSGTVTIDDTSGLVSLSDVQGDVVIDDTSGEIQLRRIAGSVDLSDGSGNIDVAKTTGRVTIHRDSTGSVRLRDIENDL